MGIRHLKPVTPATVNRTVAPKRQPNRNLRIREYLTEAEVERLMKADKEPLGPPRRHHDPRGLPPRAEGLRGGGPALAGILPREQGLPGAKRGAATRNGGPTCNRCRVGKSSCCTNLLNCGR